MQIELSGAERDIARFGIPLSLNFTTTARVRGYISLQELKAALERLRILHPMMAMRIDPDLEGGHPCYTTENVPLIPLRVVERHSNEDWAREVEREIVIPSDYKTGPLFRLVWLRGNPVSDLVLVSDHLTADGLSGIYALRDLLRLLAEPDVPLDPCLPPRYTDLVPPEMRRMIHEWVAQAAGQPTQMPERPAHTTLPPLRVIPFEFTRAQTAMLVERCRVEKVTVQAALCTAFAFPFAERQPGQPVRCVETPYNLRNRLTQPLENVYGVYISLVYSQVDCTPGRAKWDIARQVNQGLLEVTDEQLFSIPIVMIHVAEQPLGIPVVNFDYDISISNLGRVDLPIQYGDLTLESIYAPTMNVDNPFHRILGVTTFNGQMRCTYTSRDSAAPALLQRSREILSEMLN